MVNRNGLLGDDLRHLEGGSPVTTKMPKIDYDSIQIRQVEFERKRSEWNQKLKRQEMQMKRLKQHNFDLRSKLKQMNLQIDELVQQAQLKAQMDAMRENDPSLIEQKYECDHEGTIERLEDLIKRKFCIYDYLTMAKPFVMFIGKEQAIVQLQNRVDDQVALKEREISNASDKLKTAKKELKSMKKKSQMTEADRLMALQDKITRTAEQNRELDKELKMLKRQQHLQGSELNKLENTDTYQTKLKQLMEELRFAKEKQIDSTEKLSQEKAALARQRERVSTLETQLEPYADIDLAYEIRELEARKVVREEENSELIQRIIDLEQDQAAKAQENRLLMLKFKNYEAVKPSGVSGIGNLASIDRQIYQTTDVPLKARGGLLTGRGANSVGRLEPIAQSKGAAASSLSTIEPKSRGNSRAAAAQQEIRIRANSNIRMRPSSDMRNNGTDPAPQKKNLNSIQVVPATERQYKKSKIPLKR